MTIFSTNCPDDVSLRILQFLSFPGVISSNQVSKHLYKLIEQLAASHKTIDITFNGKTVSIAFDGPKSTYLHLRHHMHIFTTRPELLGNLSTTKEAVLAANGDPNNIVDLYNHVAKQNPLPLEEMLSIVLFDYTTKQIPVRGEYCLGATLKKAVDVRGSMLCGEQTEDNKNKSATSLKLIWAILFHPNPIPRKQEKHTSLIDENSIQWTLSDFIQHHDSVETVTPFLAHPQIAKRLKLPLSYAVEANRTKTALAVLSQPKAANIQAKGNFGLGNCLVSTNSPEIIQAIFSHKNANDIQISGMEGLTCALHKAAEYNKCNNNKYLEKAKMIRAFPKAERIAADGISGLTSSLHMAAIYGDKEMAKVLLSFPNAKYIPQEGKYNLQETCKQFDLPTPKDAEKKPDSKE